MKKKMHLQHFTEFLTFILRRRGKFIRILSGPSFFPFHSLILEKPDFLAILELPMELMGRERQNLEEGEQGGSFLLAGSVPGSHL
jgi:hypothetical protein